MLYIYIYPTTESGEMYLALEYLGYTYTQSKIKS